MRVCLGLSVLFHLAGCPFTLIHVLDEDEPSAPETSTTKCTICPEFEWVEVPGGTFTMGHPDRADSLPIREVTVPTFWMTRNEVTVDQYSWIESVDDDRVPSRRSRDVCNYFSTDVEQPMNCVSYDDAAFFARWVDAAIPSEAQWAYAARNGSQNSRFPWGDEASTCDRSHVEGCSAPNRSKSVCLTPDGENEWGICDLMGNLSEWTADDLHMNFEGAPTDGSVWRAPVDYGRLFSGSWRHPRPDKVIRGSSFQSSSDPHVSIRRWFSPRRQSTEVGFRLVRETAP